MFFKLKKIIIKNIQIVWYKIKKNADCATIIFLRFAMIALLTVVAFYIFIFINNKYLHLFNFYHSPAIIEQNNYSDNKASSDNASSTFSNKLYFDSNGSLTIEQSNYNNNKTYSDNITSNPFDKLDNEVLLAILSILIAFIGFMAFVFRYLVKDGIHEDLKTMAHDERIASNTEVRLSTSHIFSKLHETHKTHEKNGFLKDSFLKTAITQDKLAMQSIKKIDYIDKYKGLYLKILNNRAYNIYLKYKISNKTNMVDDTEIRISLKARHKLLEFIRNSDNYLDKNITDDHIREWLDTCEKINTLIEPPSRWKKFQDEMYNNKN